MLFDDPLKLALGLVTGFLFGFLLQKGQVAKFRGILGQLLLKDWTVVKIMGTAVAVGTIGVHLLIASGLAELHIQEVVWARLIPGAILFGIGMATLGLCPGTSVAACGQGAKDAYAGVGGMLAGAMLYVGLFPWLQGFFKSWGSLGKVTLPEVIGLPALSLALVLAGAIGLALRAFYHSPQPTLNPGGSR